MVEVAMVKESRAVGEMEKKIPRTQVTNKFFFARGRNRKKKRKERENREKSSSWRALGFARRANSKSL
jgi:hypothetical protein